MSDITLIPNDIYNQELIQQAHPPEWTNPTPNGRYNLLVIGGGSAGLVCAVGAAGVGAKVALVEKHLLGGDCLNTGCVPSKTVIRSAKVIGNIRKAADFGVHVPAGTSADFGQVMERMRKIRANISHHDSAQRFADMGIDVFLGEGQFSGSNTFEVGGQTIAFKKAVIATGSRAASLPIPGLAETGYLTNETFFQLTERPLRLAAIGAGPTGSELAQAMQRFGVQVTLFDIMPQVLGREDADAAAIVQAQMAKDGIDLCLGASISQIRQTEAGKIIEFTQNGREKSVLVDEILLAVGRRPKVESLDLEKAYIEYTKKGVTINDKLQTTNKNIYAAGDVALKYQFTHTADAAARIVLQNALFMGSKKFSDLHPNHVTLITANGEQFTAGYVVDAGGYRSILAEKFNLKAQDTNDYSRQAFLDLETVSCNFVRSADRLTANTSSKTYPSWIWPATACVKKSASPLPSCPVSTKGRSNSVPQNNHLPFIESGTSRDSSPPRSAAARW